MRVMEVMTRDVATCGPDAMLSDAAEIFWRRDCGFVPITEPATAKVIGTVTDRDACIASFTQGLPLREIPVARIMSRQVFACRPDDDVRHAQDLMRRQQVRRLPVVDESGRLVGVISLNDVARHALAAGGSDAPQRRTEIAETLGTIGQPRTAAAAR